MEIGKYYKHSDGDVMYITATGWSTYHGCERFIVEQVQQHISGRVDTKLVDIPIDGPDQQNWTEITFKEFQEIANSDETCYDITLHDKGSDLTEHQKFNALVGMCSFQLYGGELNMDDVEFDEFVEIVGKEISNGLRYESMMKNIHRMGNGEEELDGPWAHGWENRCQSSPDRDPLVAHAQRIEWLENDLDIAKVEAKYFKNQAELFKQCVVSVL